MSIRARPGATTEAPAGEADDDLHLRARNAASLERPHIPARPYLLVADGSQYAIFHLPETGELVVGRAPDANIVLEDTRASRHHAKLVVSRDSIHVVDLASRNGTFVNAHATRFARLASGDVVTIVGTRLVLCRARRRAATKVLYDDAALRERLDEEVARAIQFGRSVTLLCAELGACVDAYDSLEAAVTVACTAFDKIAWDGPHRLLVVSPELSEQHAGVAARRLLSALLPVARDARVGHATCPSDGHDAETLLAGAAAAAGAAPPGGMFRALGLDG